MRRGYQLASEVVRQRHENRTYTLAFTANFGNERVARAASFSNAGATANYTGTLYGASSLRDYRRPIRRRLRSADQYATRVTDALHTPG